MFCTLLMTDRKGNVTFHSLHLDVPKNGWGGSDSLTHCLSVCSLSCRSWKGPAGAARLYVPGFGSYSDQLMAPGFVIPGSQVYNFTVYTSHAKFLTSVCLGYIY